VNKFLAVLFLAAVSLALFGCVQQAPAPTPTPLLTPTPGQQLVGGDRDVHGCIPSAGYSWCEAKQKCLRSWEENCTETTPVPTEVAGDVCVKTGTSESMEFAEAISIAEASDCVTDGALAHNHVCNNVTGTWWIDLIPFNVTEGCNPACVVSIDGKTAEVNWRCTGLRP